MHPNEELINKFYTAFQNKDGNTMSASYAPDATFSDPAFRSLKGVEIGAMWNMLLERATDLKIRFSEIQANDTEGTAYWEADYPFSKTGNLVQNKIRASFTFENGKIKTHKDTFSLWKWMGMALGAKGYLLGLIPPARNKVSEEAMNGLKLYMKRKRIS